MPTQGNEDVIIKARLEADTSSAEQSFDKTKSKMKGMGDETNATKGHFDKLKQSMGGADAGSKSLNNSLGGVNSMMKLVSANPLIVVFAVFAGFIIALINHFKKFEAVGDAMTKAWSKVSYVFDAFLNKVLKPLIDGFVSLVNAVGDAASWIGGLFSDDMEKGADRTGELTDALDDLKDAEEENAIARAESNRALQEARELAADANVPIQERIEALKKAGQIENEQLAESIRIAETRARAVLEQIALEMGVRDELIQKIREGTIEQLKAARAEIMLMKDVDKEKIKGITQDIITTEDAGAQQAKIGKKVETGITSLQREEQSKREAAAKEHQQKLQKQRDEAARREKERKQNEAAYNEVALKLMRENELLQIKNAKDKELRVLEIAYDDQLIAYKKMLSEKKIVKSQYENLESLATESYLFKQGEINDKYKAEQKLKDDAESARKIQALNDSHQKYLSSSITVQENLIKKAQEGLEADQKIDDAKFEGKQKLAQGISSIAGILADNLGNQTIAGKGLAVAAALIDTYAAIASNLRSFSKVPIPGYAIAQSIATGLAGLAAVKKILSVKVPNKSGGGVSVDSSISIPAPVTPRQSSTSLDSNTIQGIGNAAAGGVNRTFVLESDITNNAERIRRINRAARLG